MRIMHQAVDMGVDGNEFREVTLQREFFGLRHYFMSARFIVANVVTYFLLRPYTRHVSAGISQERAPVAEEYSH